MDDPRGNAIKVGTKGRTGYGEVGIKGVSGDESGCSFIEEK